MSGFLMGRSRQTGEPIRYAGDGPIITIAPTGAGKSSGPVICNALTHPSQPVCLGDEQAQLLPAVRGVERVVHVQHDPARHLAEGRAAKIDHGPAHAQQRARIGQGPQTRDGRLRAQPRLVPEPRHDKLEYRVGAQPVRVVAVLLAGGNYQQAKADDLVKPVHDAVRITRVRDGRHQASGYVEATFHLTQHQKPTIGGKVAAIEAGDHRLTANG